MELAVPQALVVPHTHPAATCQVAAQGAGASGQGLPLVACWATCLAPGPTKATAIIVPPAAGGLDGGAVAGVAAALEHTQPPASGEAASVGVAQAPEQPLVI